MRQRAAPLDDVTLPFAELIRAHPLLVLEDVVDICLLEAPQPPAVQPRIRQLAQVPTDLEIDEMRAAVVAEQDVLRLVGVDVSDAAAMDVAQKRQQIVEESIGDGAVA